MKEGYFDGSALVRYEALFLDQCAKWCDLISSSPAVPHHSASTCGFDDSIGVDVLANVFQCPLIDMVLAPQVQRGSFTVGRCAGGLAPHAQHVFVYVWAACWQAGLIKPAGLMKPVGGRH